MDETANLQAMIQFLKDDAAKKEADAAKKEADAAKREAKYDETIRLLREDAANKEKTNQMLLNEISNLRKQLAELNRKIEFYAGKGNQTAEESSMEEESGSSEIKNQSEGDSQDAQMTPADDQFELPKNRREKRKIKFNHSSSDDEQNAKRPPPPISQENLPENVKSGELNKQIDFPPLPPTKATRTLAPRPTPVTPTPAATPAANSPKEAQKTPATRSARIPSIVIRDKKRYNALTSAFNERKYDYGRGVTVPEGIRIHPPTIDDFRHITRFLDNQKEPYHTYALEEEKHNRILIRGINEGATIDEITDDLYRQGHSPKRVIRWFHKSGEPMAIVLVLMPKDDKKIFSLRYLCNVSVKIETQRNNGRSTQCFNCQLHGHSALRCRAPPKCVKCGQGHQSSSCTKSNEDPASCANCGGPHPSSYGGCPKHPKNQRANTSAPNSQFSWGKQDNSKLAASSPSQDPAVTKQVTTFNAALQQLFQNLANMQSQFPSFMNLVNLPTQ